MIIQISDDLDLDRIAESGQCFRWEKTDTDTYRVIAGGSCLYIRDLGGGSYDLDCSREEFDSFWQDYLDLGEDYREIRDRIDPDRDPFLRQASEHEKGIRILRQDPWEMLITFIISQNRNIPAIRRSVELLSERCGEEKRDRRGRSFYAFPTPRALESLTEEDLKDCRLGYRWKYVQAAAAAVARGSFDPDSLRASGEEETLASLTSLLGVGVKVASCVSLFGLHHVDAFPIDVWMKRILEEEYPDGYPYEDYSPYNGVYQQYMFAWYRHRDEKKHKREKAEMERSRDEKKQRRKEKVAKRNSGGRSSDRKKQ